MKFKYLVIFLCLSIFQKINAQVTSQKTPPKISIGVIRWDAWYDGAGGAVQKAVEKSLGPLKYHSRLPFFAKELADDQVFIGNNSQELMDQEILLAEKAGIDYWAFVYYKDTDVMSTALKNYLKSSHNNLVNFSIIDSVGWGATYTNYKTVIDKRVNYMRLANYQLVKGNRPIYYLMSPGSTILEKYWNNDVQNFRDAISYLRTSCKAVGLADPYIVLMDYQDTLALGADALSTYAMQGSHINAPHSTLSETFKNRWETQAKTGKEIIPSLTAGWDPRPRVDNPVPWGSSGSSYYIKATEAEIVADIKDGINWASAHSKGLDSSIIIYAWNEYDEGGWLAPTFKKGDANGDTSRVDALNKLKNSFENAILTYSSNGDFTNTLADGSIQFFKSNGVLYQSKESDGRYSIFNSDFTISRYGNIVTNSDGSITYYDLSNKLLKVVFNDGKYKIPYTDGWLYYDSKGVYLLHETVLPNGAYKLYNAAGTLYESKDESGNITYFEAGKVVKILLADGRVKKPYTDGWLYYDSKGVYLLHETVLPNGAYKLYNAAGTLYESKDESGKITYY